MLIPEATIVLVIHHIQENMPTEVNLECIRSQQNNDCPMEEHPPKVQMNVKLNKGTNRLCLYDPVTHHEPYPRSGAVLIIDGNSIMTNRESQIQAAVMKPKYRKYLLKKYKQITISLYDNIHCGVVLDGQAVD